jgi:superfamily I DNA and/or RNA helicase
LFAALSGDDGTDIVKDVRTEIDRVRQLAGKTREKAKKRELYGELKLLRKEARKREEAVVDSILKSRDVILATCVGASNRLLRDIPFDMVIIDEAAQVSFASLRLF